MTFIKDIREIYKIQYIQKPLVTEMLLTNLVLST